MLSRQASVLHFYNIASYLREMNISKRIVITGVSSGLGYLFFQFCNSIIFPSISRAYTKVKKPTFLT
jgi:hypothetical protein